MPRAEDVTERVGEMLRRLTPEQLERHRVVAAHQAVLREGVRRGPNAPADGSFGGVRKSKS